MPGGPSFFSTAIPLLFRHNSRCVLLAEADTHKCRLQPSLQPTLLRKTREGACTPAHNPSTKTTLLADTHECRHARRVSACETGVGMRGCGAGAQVRLLPPRVTPRTLSRLRLRGARGCAGPLGRGDCGLRAVTLGCVRLRLCRQAFTASGGKVPCHQDYSK